MKKIIVPALFMLALSFVTTASNAQQTEDTTKLKKTNPDFKANSKDSTQQKITVNDDGVKMKKKFKKTKNDSNTTINEKNPAVKKEE